MNFTIPHLQEKARDGCVNDSTVNDSRPERRHEGYWGKAKLHERANSVFLAYGRQMAKDLPNGVEIIYRFDGISLISADSERKPKCPKASWSNCNILTNPQFASSYEEL